MQNIDAATRYSTSPPRVEINQSRHSGNIHTSAVKDQGTFKLNKSLPHKSEVRMNKITALEIHNEEISAKQHFNQKQLDILKNTICKGVSNDEFEVFLMACQKTQLDPFMRQIYAVPRTDKKTGVKNITIQTGIDGYRLIADRTGRYSPGSEAKYEYDEKGKLKSATSYIKKQTVDGTWHTVSASADFNEYCQAFTDFKTGEKKPMGLWGNMPKVMLSKCAEALAIRMAFPAETSGIYTREEMLQAESIDITPQIEEIDKPQEMVVIEKPKISLVQQAEIQQLLSKCDTHYQTAFKAKINNYYKVNKLTELDADLFPDMMKFCSNAIKETEAKKKLDVLESEQCKADNTLTKKQIEGLRHQYNRIHRCTPDMRNDEATLILNEYTVDELSFLKLDEYTSIYDRFSRAAECSETPIERA